MSTSEIADEIGFTSEEFESLLASRTEPDWLSDQRRRAWQQFGDLPLPRQSEEEWMRTDTRLLRLDDYGLSSAPSADSLLPSAQLTEGVELGGQAVSLNSHTVESSLDPKWQQQGVIFGSLDALVAEHAELVEPYLRLPESWQAVDKFAALNAACWTGGTLLYVPRGVTVDEPLHTLSALSDGGVDMGRALVILEDGAEATLLSETASDDGPGLHCGRIDLVVGPRARLRYVNLQDWGAGVWHFAHQHADVGRDASLQWTIGALGSRLAKVNQHVTLSGAGADVQVNGVMFTEGRQHLSYHTLQHHRAPHCHSDLLYKGALQDRSRLVWRGMIKVDKEAQRTDAYQRDDNLMLSAAARADSIPGLEIEADDVRCTHGATAGRVDDEQVFYARSRGLTRKEAVRMIVAGFFQTVFDRITLPGVREALGQAIGRRIREYD